MCEPHPESPLDITPRWYIAFNWFMGMVMVCALLGWYTFAWYDVAMEREANKSDSLSIIEREVSEALPRDRLSERMAWYAWQTALSNERRDSMKIADKRRRKR
jgi:hypothetical protein